MAKSVEEKQLKGMISIIRELESVHSIYLLGTRVKSIRDKYFFDSVNKKDLRQTYRYTILVISYNFIIDPKTFMNEVFNRSVELYEICSIHYTFNEVKRKLTEGDNFLSRIINESKHIFQESDELLYLPSNHLYHPTIFQQIKTEWEIRFKRALCFEEKLDVAENVAERNVRYFLLQQILRQTCLGLLYVFWEYKPTYFSLPYLLQLCYQFTPIPEIIFPKKSFRSHRIYNNLCHASYNLNNKSEIDVDLDESYKAQNLCYKFLKKAEILANKKLGELEKLHEERNVAKIFHKQ